MVGRFVGRLEVIFDQDNTTSFFYTPDDDRNSQWDATPLYTAFKVSLILRAWYPITIHGVQAFAFHPGRSQWDLLNEERDVTQGHQNSVRWINEFLRNNPPLKTELTAKADQSLRLVVPMIASCWRQGFEHGTRKLNDYFYTDVFLLVKINTVRLFLYIVLPEMHSRDVPCPAYFVGMPKRFRNDGLEEIMEHADNCRIHTFGGYLPRGSIWHRL